MDDQLEFHQFLSIFSCQQAVKLSSNHIYQTSWTFCWETDWFEESSTLKIKSRKFGVSIYIYVLITHKSDITNPISVLSILPILDAWHCQMVATAMNPERLAKWLPHTLVKNKNKNYSTMFGAHQPGMLWTIVNHQLSKVLTLLGWWKLVFHSRSLKSLQSMTIWCSR